jgi:outer membrane lipase/esterase
MPLSSSQKNSYKNISNNSSCEELLMLIQKRVAKRLLPAVVTAALALSATAANAVTFSGLYVFGDSLSDSGYFRPAIAQAIGPTAAAGLGRFTTNPGPVWAELIAQSYGGNSKPANQGGTNYAQGGAQAVGNAPASRVGPFNTQRPSATQISEYLAASGGRADPNALYSVWFGANDIFTQLEGLLGGTISQAQLSANVANTANAEVGQVARLQAAGARYVLVFGVPDIGVTPAFASNPATASVTAISAGYNTTLFNGLRASNLSVIPVDTYTLLAEVRANAAAFGFTNITTPACQPIGSSALTCSAANIPAGAANTYLYSDPVHPTSAAHAIVADFVKALIDGPNAYSTMAEVPLATRAAHIRTLDSGLRTGGAGAVGRVSAFAAGDGGKSDISANRLSPQTDSKNRSATAGVTFRASEAFTFGAAIGKTTADATMGSLGKFETDETLLSIFGSFKANGLYANFMGTAADLKFDNVKRYVKLGQVTRTNSSSTKGSNASLGLGLGYDFTFGAFSVGPFIAYTAQNVTVNGFTENANAATALSTDLKIGEQTRASKITSIGGRASVDIGKWTPFARISLEQESSRDERFVTASPVTIAQGISYEIPGYRPGKKWGAATLGVRGSITDQISLALIYSGTFSRTNVKEDGFTANVAFAF